MAVICPECNKQMPTDVVLKGHLVKAHGATVEVNPEEAKADGAVESTEDGNEEDLEEDETPVVKTTDDVVVDPVKDSVTIRSADSRNLEVSVNGVAFNGKEIVVPKEQEGDIRKILADGGFFLKD